MVFFKKNKTGQKKDQPYTDLGIGFDLDDRSRIIDLTIPDQDRKRHTFVFGTTGVGKTRLAEHLIEQDIRKGHSIAFFDPKGDQEIFSKIVQVAKECGRLNELMLVTPIFPECSAIIDPMSYYFMVDELVGHVVSGIKAGNEPYFRNIAKGITMSVILALQILAKARGTKPVLNFNELRQGTRRSSLMEYREALTTITSPEARDVIGMIDDVLEHPEEHYAKVSSSLRTALLELSSGNIGGIIGKAKENRFHQGTGKGEPSHPGGPFRLPDHPRGRRHAEQGYPLHDPVVHRTDHPLRQATGLPAPLHLHGRIPVPALPGDRRTVRQGGQRRCDGDRFRPSP